MTTVADLPYYHLVPRDIEENLAFRRFIYEKGYENPEFAEELWIMCSRDVLFYLSVFAWVNAPHTHPNCPAQPFIPHPFQETLILRLCDAVENASRDNPQQLLIDKSREQGVTTCNCFADEWRWHFRKNQSFLWGSRTDDDVDKADNPDSLFSKIDFLHEHQPIWLLPTDRHLGRDDSNRTNKHLKNADTGSVIDGDATTKHFGRGGRRVKIFVDEAGAIDILSQIHAAVQSNSNCLVINSTPAPGSYYDWLRDSGNIPVLQYHWSDHPEKARGLYTWENGGPKILDNSFKYPEGYKFQPPKPDAAKPFRSHWYDVTDAITPAWIMSQEYDMSSKGASRQFFETKFIMELIDRYACDPIYEGDLTHELHVDGLDELRDVEWQPMRGGFLKLWISMAYGDRIPHGLYAIGADIATGKGGEMSSNSVASIIELATGRKVGEYANPGINPVDFARHCVALALWFHSAYLIWEANGPGNEFGKEIERLEYENIFYRKQNEKSSKKKKSRVAGWWSGKQEKRALLSKYKTALGLGHFQNPSRRALEEAGDYLHMPGGSIEHSKSRKGANPDPTAVGEEHGDRVIADALCERARSERQPAWSAEATIKSKKRRPRDIGDFTKVVSRPSELPVGTMARRLAELDFERAKTRDEEW